MRRLATALIFIPAAAAAEGNARRFAPTPVLSPYVTLDGSRSHGRGAMAFGALTTLEHRPLVFYRDGEVTSEIVAERLTLDLSFAYGLTRRLDVGATLPVVTWQTGNGLPGAEALPTTGLGDPGLGARFALLDTRESPVGLALIGTVTAPLGDQNSFAAEKGPSGRIRMALDVPISHRLDLTTNVGYHLRPEGDIDDVAVGDDFIAGLAASWRLSTDWAVLGEVTAATSVSDAFDTEATPAEVNLGARWRLFGDYEVVGGVGAGVLPGYGAPAWRAFVGLESSPRRHDWDGDLVLDHGDACLREFGVIANDGCPLLAETGDADADGLADAVDECPDIPEDADGFMDHDGCPDPDNDLDFIADADDAAPLSPEDWDAFEDADGRPDTDNDHDGIADAIDSCPMQKGGGNGCPGSTSAVAKTRGKTSGPNAPLVLGDTLHPARPILFEFAKPALSAAAAPLIHALATYLTEHPELRQLEVGVHVDSMGSRRWKHQLSRRRAKSVRQALIKAGIAPRRLTAKGYGPEVPVATNKTKAGRARNRRVELRVLQRTTEAQTSARSARP